MLTYILICVNIAYMYFLVQFMDKDNEQQESEDERNVSDSKSDSVDCEYVEDDKANQASQGQQDQESAILDSTTYNYSD